MKVAGPRRFVGYAKDSACFLDSLSSLVKVYAKHVLRRQSNITKSEERVQASKMFEKEMASNASKRGVDNCTVPPGLVPLRTSPFLINHFLGSMYKLAMFLCRDMIEER